MSEKYMDIREFIIAAYRVDGIKLEKFCPEHGFENVSVTYNEIFLKYPTTPYRDEHPNATDKEIFEKRILPHLYPEEYFKLITGRDYPILFDPEEGSA